MRILQLEHNFETDGKFHSCNARKSLGGGGRVQTILICYVGQAGSKNQSARPENIGSGASVTMEHMERRTGQRHASDRDAMPSSVTARVFYALQFAPSPAQFRIISFSRGEPKAN